MKLFADHGGTTHLHPTTTVPARTVIDALATTGHHLAVCSPLQRLDRTIRPVPGQVLVAPTTVTTATALERFVADADAWAPPGVTPVVVIVDTYDGHLALSAVAAELAAHRPVVTFGPEPRWQHLAARVLDVSARAGELTLDLRWERPAVQQRIVLPTVPGLEPVAVAA